MAKKTMKCQHIFLLTCSLLILTGCGIQHYFDEAVVNVYSYILEEEQFNQLLDTEHPDVEQINDTEIFSTRISKEHFASSLTFDEKSQSNHHREYWVQGNTRVTDNWSLIKYFSSKNRLRCGGMGIFQTHEVRGRNILEITGSTNTATIFMEYDIPPKTEITNLVYKKSAKLDEVFLFYQKIELPQLTPHYHTLIISVSSTK